MKKLNLLKKQFVFIIFLLVFGIFNFSCTSSKVNSDFIYPALLYLSNGYDLYLSFKADSNNSIQKIFFDKYLPNLSEKEKNMVISRLNNVCVASYFSKDIFQISIDGDIPSKYVSKLFTKKNGWEKNGDILSLLNVSIFDEDFKFDHVYLKNSNLDLELCSPTDTNLFIGSSVYSMISNFIAAFSGNNNNRINNDAYNWLHLLSSDEIKFYSANPNAFLSYLLGDNLNLQLTRVYGSFRCSTDNQDVFYLDMYLNFKNENYKKASKSLLNFTFGLTDAISDDEENPSMLKISGLELSKEQIINVLNIKNFK